MLIWSYRPELPCLVYTHIYMLHLLTCPQKDDVFLDQVLRELDLGEPLGLQPERLHAAGRGQLHDHPAGHLIPAAEDRRMSGVRGVEDDCEDLQLVENHLDCAVTAQTRLCSIESRFVLKREREIRYTSVPESLQFLNLLS